MGQFVILFVQKGVKTVLLLELVLHAIRKIVLSLRNVFNVQFQIVNFVLQLKNVKLVLIYHIS